MTDQLALPVIPLCWVCEYCPGIPGPDGPVCTYCAATIAAETNIPNPEVAP